MPVFFLCLLLFLGHLNGWFETEIIPPHNPEVAALLPKGVSLGTPLINIAQQPTIKDELVRLGARVEKGIIVDRNGKEIVFVRFDGPARGRGGVADLLLQPNQYRISIPMEREPDLHPLLKLEQNYTVIKLFIANK